MSVILTIGSSSRMEAGADMPDARRVSVGRAATKCETDCQLANRPDYVRSASPAPRGIASVAATASAVYTDMCTKSGR
jgi:hypothetical protein